MDIKVNSMKDIFSQTFPIIYFKSLTEEMYNSKEIKVNLEELSPQQLKK